MKLNSAFQLTRVFFCGWREGDCLDGCTGPAWSHARDLSVAMDHYRKGYSFFELMLGFVIVALVSVFAIPSLVQANHTYKLVSAANDVQSRLQFARIRAINRNADHRIRVVNSLSYVLERRTGGLWIVEATYGMANGFSISAPSTAEFHARGNANPVTTFTLTNPRSETRQVEVETSGYTHAN